MQHTTGASVSELTIFYSFWPALFR